MAARTRRSSLRWMVLGGVVIAAVSLLPSLSAQSTSSVDVSSLLIPGRVQAVEPALLGARGNVEVWITLADPSVSKAAGRNAKKGGGLLTADGQRTHARGLDAKQEAVAQEVRRAGGRELARVNKAHNALAVAVDASALPAIAALPEVIAIRRVRNYRVDLSETVPYIGAAAVQASGIDGTGVTVAVLDTGVDYTHRNFGGPGTPPAYTAAFGVNGADSRNTTRDGLFPTAKVVDGFDFVGEAWPDAARAEDPDPIDFDGHGTHVADIIAGHSLDDTHRGVAPGASLIAVKTCSSISTACSGIALLKALDFVLDPNGDGDLSDAVDVVNMSLGSDYGQEQDDLSESAQDLVDFGVVVAAAAGNAGNRPYIVNSPAIAPGVIGVAQTQVPSAVVIPLIINAPPAIAGTYGNTATLAFAPVTSTVTANVAYVGRGCPAGSISAGSPPDAYLANPAGKIALIDRGACNVSLKVDRAASAGATGVLIGLVAPGDAVTFAFGGGTTFVPSLVIIQSTSNLIKSNIAAPVNATISPAAAIPLVTSMVSSSARGPSYSLNAIKPDIGAPGGSVSAQVGTGTGETAFGGTSGATPMVAGSAALLVQAYSDRKPHEIKAMLMNTANTSIYINPATQPGVLAPITMIGGGEVRVDRALASKTAAWDKDTETPSLSFGYEAVTKAKNLQRHVTIQNYSNDHRTYNITPQFRYVNDQASGAVVFDSPGPVHVPPHGHHSFEVKLSIDPAKLPIWTLNGGSQGGNGSLLQTVEFDGYIEIADAVDTVRLPWHLLPHRAAAVGPAPNKKKLNLGKDGHGELELENNGTRDGRLDVFSLTGTSPKIPKRELPEPGDNFAIVDLQAVGVRLVPLGGDAYALQFGITTHGERSHPNYPAEFDIYVDTNRDGDADYVIFNSENGGFAATGQNVVSVLNLNVSPTPPPVTRFFADADLDSANMIFTVLLSDLGMTPSTQFDFLVVAGDNYFTGNITDVIDIMTYQPDTPRFVASVVPAGAVLAGGSSTLVIDEITGGASASPSQSGLLLLYKDGAPGKEADAIILK